MEGMSGNDAPARGGQEVKHVDDVIAEIGKNAIERVRVRLTEYAGHRLVDARVYFEGDNGEWVPTKKGLALSAPVAKQVAQAIMEASDALDGAA
jgi:hypothetical protein